MSIYRRILYPLLCRMDAEAAHHRAAALLAFAQALPPGRFLLRRLAGRIPSRPVRLWGLTFPNVLGLAAGFDKDARLVSGMAALGFGHVEVGTLTPRPQPGNPRPRIFRLVDRQALINRMGFPNAGVAAAVPRLRAFSRRPRGALVGISIGKQKDTPLEEAAADYIETMRAVYPYADYLAVNVSSPNTPGLRELQNAAYLSALLTSLMDESRSLAARHAGPRRPLLVKLAPDFADADLDETLAAAQAAAIDGIVATNTTLSRAGVEGHPLAAEQGGLSGRPLAETSTRMIARIARATGGRLPIIGVGGVFTADDVRAKLDAGASLVQLYTSLVYEGPSLPGRLLRGLADADDAAPVAMEKQA
jgi:dihydroorotate dehydrogenase